MSLFVKLRFDTYVVNQTHGVLSGVFYYCCFKAHKQKYVSFLQFSYI